MGHIAYDVVIIGGSYAGLSAAMTLGRSVRKVLVIDNRRPCNETAPQAHNLLTHDGETPAAIAAKAREQLTLYKTVELTVDNATGVVQNDGYFEVTTGSAKVIKAKKILFATGIKDIMPDTPGFADCWGISVIHCPYCHGYEVYGQKLAVFGNGDEGFEYAKLISNWSKDITLFTNGVSTLSAEQLQQLQQHHINVVETKIAGINHNNGHVQNIALINGSSYPVDAIFSRVPFEQHTNISQQLGCINTKIGHIEVDGFGATSVPGVYAAGDNSSPMRGLANAMATGLIAGVIINKTLIDEEF
jgi:thioredoxin reductase